MKAYKTITLKQIIVLLVMIIVSYGCGRSQEEINVSQLQEEINVSQLQGRTGVWYKIDSETPYTGRVVDKYSSGQKKRELTYKDGIPDGPATAWYENGQKAAELTFKDGEIFDSKSWDEDGNLQ